MNGVPFNESMIFAAGAARLKIPLIMVSGDDQLEREIRRNLPWVQYAPVKHAVDRSRAEAFDRAEVNRRIENAARQALMNLKEARVFEFTGPYRFALTFQDEAQARNAALVPGAELAANQMVQIGANDFEEGYRLSTRMIGLASMAGRNSANVRVIGAQSNSADLRTKVTDWLYDRARTVRCKQRRRGGDDESCRSSYAQSQNGFVVP